MTDKLRRVFLAFLATVVLFGSGAFTNFNVLVSAINSTGTCGNGVTYTYDNSTCVLTISGNGQMYDYDDVDSPFHESLVKTVNITGNVTHIGRWAFNNCDNLENVNIGDSVTSIGAYAFSDCSAIENIHIPKNVTSIGEGAFSNEESLQGITVDVNNFYFSSDDVGALYNNNKTVLYQYPIGLSRETYTLNSSTLTVKAYSFWNADNLCELILNESILRIEESAFRYADSIDYVYYPGTEAKWKDVRIASNNDSFTNATFRYCKTIIYGTSETVNLSYGESKYYVFTPTRSATYSIYATGSYDNVGTLYYAGQELAYSDDYNSRNFGFSKVLTARESYIIETRMYSSSSSGYYPINISATTYDSTAPYLSWVCSNNVATTQTLSFTLYDNIEVDGYYWGTSSQYSDNRYITVPAKNIVSFDRLIYNPGTYYLVIKDTSGNLSKRYELTFYKTEFKANGGSVSPSYVITRAGNSFNLPTPQKNGSVFRGWSIWSTSENGVTGSFKPTANTVQNAIWHTHSYKGKVTKTATCKSTGTKTYTCSGCSDSYKETIPKTSHKWKAATCKNPKTCSVCGATTGSKLEHKYTSKVTKAATCKSTGTKTYTCSGCGNSYKETISKTSHKYTSKVTKAATCKSTGVRTYTCSVCKDSYKKTISKISHKYSYKVTKAATTSKDGTRVATCSNCKGKKTYTIYKIKSVSLSATSYIYDGKTKTPTVTVKDSNGNTLKKDTDYTVSYSSGRKALGSYNVKITFKGKYSGSVTKKFEIKLGKVKNFKQDKPPKNCKLLMRWDKVAGAQNYQIQWYDSKNQKWSTVKFSNNKTTTSNTYVKAAKTVGTQKWRVRAVYGSGKKAKYGAWSNTLTTKS